jgi:hypothetical protein
MNNFDLANFEFGFTFFSKIMPYFCRSHSMSIHNIQLFSFVMVKLRHFLYPKLETPQPTWSWAY